MEASTCTPAARALAAAAFKPPAASTASTRAPRPAKAREADGEETVCPLCCEDFTDQEKGFLPCSCSYKVRTLFLAFLVIRAVWLFATLVIRDRCISAVCCAQICIWCWHRLRDSGDGCPACRIAYPVEPFKFAAKAKLQQPAADDKGKKKKKKKAAAAVEPSSSHSPASGGMPPLVEQSTQAPAPPLALSPPAPPLEQDVGINRGQAHQPPQQPSEEGEPETPAAKARNKKKKKKGAAASADAAQEPDAAPPAAAAPELSSPTRDSSLEAVMAFLALEQHTRALLLGEDFDTGCVLDSTAHDFESIGCSAEDSGKLVQWAYLNR
jgi:hypothetical protein